jgi:hypothetical protein
MSARIASSCALRVRPSTLVSRPGFDLLQKPGHADHGRLVEIEIAKVGSIPEAAGRAEKR